MVVVSDNPSIPSSFCRLPVLFVVPSSFVPSFPRRLVCRPFVPSSLCLVFLSSPCLFFPSSFCPFVSVPSAPRLPPAHARARSSHAQARASGGLRATRVYQPYTRFIIIPSQTTISKLEVVVWGVWSSAEKLKIQIPLLGFDVNHHGDNPSIYFKFLAITSLPTSDNPSFRLVSAITSLPNCNNPNFLLAVAGYHNLVNW